MFMRWNFYVFFMCSSLTLFPLSPSLCGCISKCKILLVFFYELYGWQCTVICTNGAVAFIISTSFFIFISLSPSLTSIFLFLKSWILFSSQTQQLMLNWHSKNKYKRRRRWEQKKSQRIDFLQIKVESNSAIKLSSFIMQ